MHDLSYLQDLLIILGFAVIVLLIFDRLRLPPIAGFILTGILVGPGSLGLIGEARHVEVLAEIGVSLLLFGIGVELALGKIKRLWRLVVYGGLLQVGITTLAVFIISRLFGVNGRQSIFLGIVVALSSTAIVLRGLQQRGEVSAPHGQLSLGILIFQDLSVVPAMLLLPFLIDTGSELGSFPTTLGKSVGIIALVLVLATVIVPRVMKLVVRTRQRQLFILTIFVICIGTAWLVTKSGASLPIGAFLAGLVVSGSEYRHQAMSDMIPFREVFSGLFFVSIGMLLSPVAMLANTTAIVGTLLLILTGKSLIVFVTAAIVRMPLRACLIAALGLAQVGEFSFILLYSVKGSGLISASQTSTLMSAAIVSMFVTPFAMSLAPRLAAGLGRYRFLSRFADVKSVEDASANICELCDHVIVAGYGFAGRELARALSRVDIPFVVVDINSRNVQVASQETGQAVFGDVTSESVLKKLGVSRARELVLLINDTSASELAVQVARGLAPNLFISVRTMYLQDADSLLKAGANEVVASEREAAVQISAQVLQRNRVAPALRRELASEIRSHSEDDDP